MIPAVERPRSAKEAVEPLTREVRRFLEKTEDEPVGVMTGYRDSVLKLTDAIDHLAREVDARTGAQDQR